MPETLTTFRGETTRTGVAGILATTDGVTVRVGTVTREDPERRLATREWKATIGSHVGYGRTKQTAINDAVCKLRATR